jgi:hypothetical protein
VLAEPRLRNAAVGSPPLRGTATPSLDGPRLKAALPPNAPLRLTTVRIGVDERGTA